MLLDCVVDVVRHALALRHNGTRTKHPATLTKDHCGEDEESDRQNANGHFNRQDQATVTPSRKIRNVRLQLNVTC